MTDRGIGDPGSGHPLDDEIEAILSLPREDRRAAFSALRAHHPDEVDLLADWERALEHAPGSVADGDDPAAWPTTRGIPRRIGRYRVLSRLGEGGMGTVYLAEQREPVRRRVALKVVRVGVDSTQMQARFSLERQALALMNHSAIARVYDVGVTEAGQPFLAMEFVHGLPLDAYCDRHRLSIDERLELLRRVCEGVQHAHQKGIVHRDLKPANVVVTEENGRAVPKLIDFGLARATDHAMLDGTLFTQGDAMLGTPEYMSPEQADPSLGDVDTRTDIYALGVMLYQVLVGELPFPSAQLRRAGLAEACRVICEEVPPRPSARFLGLPDRDAVAGQRCTTPAALARRLRGDLDWIVMRAIEKERSRRYETANGLSKDITRHIEHEPVSAGPPSTAYRMRKLLQRKRGQCLAAAVSLVALIAGLIASLHFWHLAVEQGELAQLAAAEKEVERDAAARLATQNAALAQAERTANELAQHHLELFQLLRYRVQLDAAIEDAAAIHPAWPERVDALTDWVRTKGEPLAAGLDEVRRARDVIRTRALPATAADLEVERAFVAERVAPKRRILDALRAAADVRAGRRVVEVPPLARSESVLSAGELNDLAWPLVTWQPDRRAWGNEARGLALARRAWRKVLDGDSSVDADAVADTLAWANFAVGLDADARTAMRDALMHADDVRRAAVAAQYDQLELMIAQVTGGGWEALETALATEIAELTDRAADQRAWRFAADADVFLHRTLVELCDALVEFGAPHGELAWMRTQRDWAGRIEARSITDRADAWRAASRQIAADARYGQLHVRPQIGLVPIGANPVTGLWEFHHLRSAASPDVAPRRGPDGFVRADPGNGIVFVLVPAGTYLQGAQPDDPSRPNYDPSADLAERPTPCTVNACFVAAHEITQDQWARLARGSRPSRLPAGNRYPTPTGFVEITGRNPVEGVSWDDAVRVLESHGLRLPSLAEWEYAARAGTTTPWCTGGAPATLEGAANLADQTATTQSGWDVEPWFDGHIYHAPAGSFRPNAWGFWDVHGNVAEWCADEFAPDLRVHRGGSFDYTAAMARVAAGYAASASTSDANLGVRAARWLRGE